MKTTNNNYTEEEYHEKIKYLINTGQGDKAVDLILESTVLYPRNGEFYFLKGGVLRSSENYEEAVKCFEKAEKYGYNPVHSLRCQANCYFNHDRNEEAIECCDRAIEIDPDDSETWYSKGRILISMDKFEEAYICFKKATELSPESPSYQEFKRLASEEIRKIKIPKDLEASLTNKKECLEKGSDFMDEELYKSAHVCFKKAVEYNPDDDEAWGWLGIALMELENYDESLNALDKAISLNEVPDWLSCKSMVLNKLEKTEEAIKCMSKALEMDPGNEGYWFFLGGLFADKWNFKEAIRCYKNVTSLNPERAVAWREMGDITLHRLKKYEEALDYYDKVIELNPDDDDTMLMKGVALSYAGKEKEAIKWYDKALKINPYNHQAMENKGTSLIRLGKQEESKACYMNAAKINPCIGNFFYHGSLALAERKYEEAIEYFDEELKMYPANRTTLSMKGWSLAKLGRYEEAMRCFLKCEYNVLNILVRLVNGDNMRKSIEEKRGIIPYIDQALRYDDFFMSISEQIKENFDLYKDIYIWEMEIISLLSVYLDYEELIAHYTKETVAEKMLVEKSQLWLSMVTKSNDPKEGQSLLDYFYGKNASGKGGYIDEQFGVFSASFTFNIDHLNHFRLYGKSADGVAAGGVSIVVDQLLFKDPHYEKGAPSSVSPVAEERKIEKGFELDKDKDLRLPLFRCIYIDPDTGFVASLGQREEYTFHQLNEDGKNEVDQIDSYKNRINDTLHEVRQQLAELKTKIEKLDPEIVSQLMLPLRYLIKNVSFKEEQECRIFVVKSLADKNMKTCKINNIEKKYFDYFEINERVNKVILGTNCKLRNDEDFLNKCKINKKEDIIPSIWQFT